MKKWLKIIAKILGAIIVLIAIFLTYSIDSIDTAPYFESNYYKRTISSLDSAIEKSKIVEGIILAGFGKVNITPQIVEGKQNPSEGKFSRIKMPGFGDGQHAIAVHDSLFVKVIAFELADQQLVIISADLLMIPEELSVKVANKLAEKDINLRRGQLLFGATHTHAGVGNSLPGYIGKQFGGEYQPEVVEWLSVKFTDAIIAALGDKKPAKMGSGFIHAPNLVRNRIIGETGRLNDRLTVLSVKQDSARQAVVGVFAAHATIVGRWNNQFSADYPGYFQRRLESSGIDMAMFMAGTVGSHTNKSPGERFERAQNMGQALADSSIVVLEEIEHLDSTSLLLVSEKIEIPKLQVIYVADGLRINPTLGWKLLPPVESVYMQSLRLNDLVWITMPCEFSGEYAIDLQNALELQGYNSAITSFNGQYLGYIVPSRYYYYDTYEARLMGWYGPSMGDYLMELNYKLANSLTKSRL